MSEIKEGRLYCTTCGKVRTKDDCVYYAYCSEECSESKEYNFCCICGKKLPENKVGNFSCSKVCSYVDISRIWKDINSINVYKLHIKDGYIKINTSSKSRFKKSS